MWQNIKSWRIRVKGIWKFYVLFMQIWSVIDLFKIKKFEKKVACLKFDGCCKLSSKKAKPIYIPTTV
jgi:hypothetical protein